MKTLMLSLIVLASSASFASSAISTKDVNAGSMTCADLQSQLAANGSMYIVQGPNSWGNEFYSDASSCPTDTRANPAYVYAQDGWCETGYVCMPVSSGQ